MRKRCDCRLSKTQLLSKRRESLSSFRSSIRRTRKWTSRKDDVAASMKTSQVLGVFKFWISFSLLIYRDGSLLSGPESITTDGQPTAEYEV